MWIISFIIYTSMSNLSGSENQFNILDHENVKYCVSLVIAACPFYSVIIMLQQS